MSSILLLLPLAFVVILSLPFKFLSRLVFPVTFLILVLQVLLVAGKGFGLCNLDSFNLLSFIEFRVDSIALVMLLSIAIVCLASLLVSKTTVESGKSFNFINLLLLSLVGMNGVVMVTDIFSMYIFLEIIAVTSFILIAFDGRKNGFEGSFKYIILSAVATVFILTSIGLLLLHAGNTSFVSIRDALEQAQGEPILILASIMFLVGLLIKSGTVPFHGWLPDAYSSAPSSVSILLAGIVTKTTGVYTMIRIFTDVFHASGNIQAVIMIFGTVSILVGALAALGQKDFKRMLAFSSISQVGYIVLSLGCGTALGIAGAVFHLFNHSMFKSLLFVNSAAVEKVTGTTDMDSMGGLSDKMPVTSFTSIIAFLSTAGVPPLSGFWSKLIIIVALWTSGHEYYASIAVIASLITLAYMLSMQRRVFFGKLRAGFEHLREANLWIIVPSVCLAIIIVVVGLLYPYVVGTFIMPVRGVIW